MKEPSQSPSRILESEGYVMQKEIIANSINRQVFPIKRDGVYFAPARLADLRRLMNVDYNTFKKSGIEKHNLKTLKSEYRKQMRKKHKNWTKRTSTKKEFIEFYNKDIW